MDLGCADLNAAKLHWHEQCLNPDKTFIPAPPDDETCGCNNCKYMKMVTLENICECLEREAPEIVLDEEVRRKAERSILNMINIK